MSTTPLMLQALDNKMSEWGVALVVVLLLAVVAVAVAVLVRLFGVYHLAHCFASDEERAVLTKSEQTGNGMLVSTPTLTFMNWAFFRWPPSQKVF